MSDSRKISLCIPSWNRFEMTVESFAQVLNDDRIQEVVIVDDCSTDNSFSKLTDHFAGLAKENIDLKVRLFLNDANLDCYKNKANTIIHSVNTDWCILLDSDNIIAPDYLNKIFAINRWYTKTVYAPTFASPHFDYRQFNGLKVDRNNVKEYLHNQTFLTALNTANYFVNRKTYLDAFDPEVNPVTADSIYMAYRFLEQGCTIHFVEDLTYQHRVHEGSHYVANNHKTGNFYEETLQKLKAL